MAFIPKKCGKPPWARLASFVWEKANRMRAKIYVAYGKTDAGRYLTIFFLHKSGNEALIISACDMDSKERKLYGKK